MKHLTLLSPRHYAIATTICNCLRISNGHWIRCYSNCSADSGVEFFFHTNIGCGDGVVCRYVLAFSLGAGPVPALLLPEIFASRIRGKAVALSMGVHWVFQHMIPTFLNSCAPLLDKQCDLMHCNYIWSFPLMPRSSTT